MHCYYVGVRPPRLYREIPRRPGEEGQAVVRCAA